VQENIFKGEANMGFFDKVKEIISENDDDDFDDFYEDGGDRGSFGIAPPARDRARHERVESSERFAERSRTKRHDSDKVVNIHTTAQLQVVLVKPERFEEAAAIGDNLNEKRTVVLNLESTNRDIARRLLDFLSGVAYASNGQIKRVANSTYIITPYNVDVMGDLIDELENNGMFM
jgi:cell division inhibitor SepF